MTSILHKLRAIFLSPNSNLELRLRTLYHRISATRLAFNIQNWRTRRSYRKWRGVQESLEPPQIEGLDTQPKVSFLLNYSPEVIGEVKTTIRSIQNLTFQNWEVLLFPIDEGNTAPLLAALQQDVRIKQIKNKQIFKLDQLTSAFLVFCAPGDRFSKHLLAYFYKALNANPSADLIYYDCDYTSEESSGFLPFFKPDAFSPELLFSVNYLSRGFIRKNAAAAQITAINQYSNLIAAEYEITLWLVEQGAQFEHIPQLLVSQSKLPTPKDPDNTQMILTHLTRLGRQKAESKKLGTQIRFSWQFNDPSIAIIIPTKNHPSLLMNLVTSILEKTEYQNYTINLVDNDSDDDDTLAYYETLKRLPRCRIIPFHESFNYSHAINRGVEQTESDLLLFLNDDMEVIDPHWLAELAQWAMVPEIGVVGARLLRANHTLQHAGIIIGLNGYAGHIYLNAPEHYSGLFGSADWYRNYLAVTGACQMVRRDLFNEVGGYNENFRLAFGDIDFCLRIYNKGYRNLYTPFVNLFHYEGKARGFDTPVEDILHGYEEMEEFIQKDDPYFSPNLTYTRIPVCDYRTPTRNLREQQIEERKKLYFPKG